MQQKILIIRFSSIGDIVLTTPVIRCLRSQLNAEVHFLTKPAFSSILNANPNVSKVHTLTDDARGLMASLKAEKFDLVIDLHHNLRTRRIKSALRVKSHSFYKANIEKWLMVNVKIDRLPKTHIVDRYMDTVSSLGVTNDGGGLDFFIPPDKKVDVLSQFALAPFHYIAIVIGAAHATKCMTADQIRDLCNQIDQPIMLIGGKEEMPKAKAILKGIKNDRVRNAVGVLDIMQSASVLEQAQHIITHDTGMMHIAAALKKEQTVIWGNTIPGFGMYPYYGNHNVAWRSFEITGLSCRPCSKIGYDKCPKGHFKCMLQHDLKSISIGIG